MLCSFSSHCTEVSLSACWGHIQKEVFCESTILDIGKDLLHGLLGFFCDDLRSGDVIAVLGCVGDGVSHSGESRLIDQVYDQFHLMDTLEVCVSWVVSSLAQSLKSSLHQGAYTAAENCLLTEQVCFGLQF